MKILKITTIVILILNTNQMLTQLKENKPSRKLEPEEAESSHSKVLPEQNEEGEEYTQNQIVYHVHQDLLSRKIIYDKVFDGRDLDDVPLIDSKHNFEYEKDAKGKYIYRVNPHNVSDIKDIKKLSDMIKSIKITFKDDILKGVVEKIGDTKLTKGYNIYQNLQTVTENYYVNKVLLLKEISKLKDYTGFALDYAMSHKDTDMKDLVGPGNVELNEHNKIILEQLLEKLDEKVLEYWDKFYNHLDDIFSTIHDFLENEHMSNSEKIAHGIEGAIRVSIFENDVIDKMSEEIINLASLVLDNPKYNHLADSFDKDLDMGGEPEQEEDEETEGEKENEANENEENSNGDKNETDKTSGSKDEENPDGANQTVTLSHMGKTNASVMFTSFSLALVMVLI